MVNAISDAIGRITGGAGETKQPASGTPGRQGGDDALSVDFSASHDVFSAVDDFFNVGGTGHLDAPKKLAPAEKEQFFKIVAELLKGGYMGYEKLVVNNKVERHDLDMQIGDERLRHARLYNEPKRKR